jgi:hypothetical protein
VAPHDAKAATRSVTELADSVGGAFLGGVKQCLPQFW